MAGHRLMLFEYGKGPNRLIELDVSGKVVWEHKPPSLAVIFSVLPNGNILYAYGGKPTGVREVTRKGEEVWNYVSKCPQVLGCERLSNGNTLIGEQGPSAQQRRSQPSKSFAPPAMAIAIRRPGARRGAPSPRARPDPARAHR